MRTAKACLIKAEELEQQARLCPAPDHAAALISMATTWRQLAQQALWQDAAPHLDDPGQKPDDDTAPKAS